MEAITIATVVLSVAVSVICSTIVTGVYCDHHFNEVEKYVKLVTKDLYVSIGKVLDEVKAKFH